MGHAYFQFLQIAPQPPDRFGFLVETAQAALNAEFRRRMQEVSRYACLNLVSRSLERLVLLEGMLERAQYGLLVERCTLIDALHALCVDAQEASQRLGELSPQGDFLEAASLGRATDRLLGFLQTADPEMDESSWGISAFSMGAKSLVLNLRPILQQWQSLLLPHQAESIQTRQADASVHA